MKKMTVKGSHADVAMLPKRVFVLACALAIVGIGACFLPPQHVSPPPLPPYLAQVRTISIQVQDISGKDLIDGDAMSRAVASKFTDLWKEYSVSAKAFQSSTHSDATLKLTLTQKSASLFSTDHGKQVWKFELTSSSTLTASDGRLLWQKQNQNSPFLVWHDNGLPPGGWNSRIVMKQAADSLAMYLGQNILLTSPPRRTP
jgi:hypothetical protein